MWSVSLHVGKDDKHFGFTRVTDPHLATIDDIVITLVFSTGLESKGIATSTSFRDTETTDGISSKASQVLFLKIIVGPFTDHGVGQSVLKKKKIGTTLLVTIIESPENLLTYVDITQSTDGRINLGEFYKDKEKERISMYMFDMKGTTCLQRPRQQQ